MGWAILIAVSALAALVLLEVRSWKKPLARGLEDDAHPFAMGYSGRLVPKPFSRREGLDKPHD